MNLKFKNLDSYDKLMYFTQCNQILSDNNIRIVIDKLRLCYNIVDNTILNELEIEKPEIYRLLDFDLVRVDGRYHMYNIIEK